MPTPADPPEGVVPESLREWAQNVADTLQALDVGAVTSVDGQTGAVDLSDTYAPLVDPKMQVVARTDRLVAWDTFDRADGPLGASDSGHTWTALVGAFSVASNVAKATPAGGEALAVVDTGLFEGEFEVDYAGNGGGLIFRAIDANNFLLVQWGAAGVPAGVLRLFKRDVGTFTQLASSPGIGWAQGSLADNAKRLHRLRVIVYVDKITVLVDGTNTIVHTLSAADQTKFGAATLAGIRLPNDLDSADNFLARSSTPVPF